MKTILEKSAGAVQISLVEDPVNTHHVQIFVEDELEGEYANYTLKNYEELKMLHEAITEVRVLMDEINFKKQLEEKDKRRKLYYELKKEFEQEDF